MHVYDPLWAAQLLFSAGSRLGTGMGLLGGWVCVVLFCASIPVAAQQSASSAQTQGAPDRDHPALSHRPQPAPGSIPEGKIKIDVVVTDQAGRPVAGLERKDFTLLDNKKARPILSFRAVDGALGAGPGEPPVEVILLIDAANTSLQRVAYTRQQVENYLHQNAGRLRQPTSVLLFFDLGIKAWLKPSTDGNLLAEQLQQSATATHKIPLTKGYDEMELLSLSIRELGSIATAEASTPGRKMLIWIGPGWPLLDSRDYAAPASTRQQLFNAMLDLSQTLRESRVTLYSIFPIDPAFNDAREAEFYRSYLRGVTSTGRTEPGNLALPVFAIHSGGRALDTAGDLPMLINSCVQEAGAYYMLSFDPATAKHVDEYHEIAVRVDKPQLKARTSTGYYAEPSFQFDLQH